jgi:predicted nucleotidyltransferase
VSAFGSANDSREDGLRLVARLKERMAARKVSFSRTVLFGSRARGEGEAGSDVDVLVIVDELDPGLRETISYCAWEVGFEAGTVVQTVVRTRAQVEDGPERSSLLMLAVEDEGILV